MVPVTRQLLPEVGKDFVGELGQLALNQAFLGTPKIDGLLLTNG